MIVTTKAQRQAIARLYARNPDCSDCYRHFRKRVIYSFGAGCLMIHWCNMWLGIEPDGYTHS
jgi:hypothetical protein